MFVILDTNEVWRFKPFRALSKYMPVLGVYPQDIVTSIRKGQKVLPISDLIGVDKNFYTLSISMIPSWATRSAFIAQPLLWRRIRAVTKKLGAKIDYIVITIPHYYELLKRIPANIKVIYYASDDYRLYQDWDPKKIIAWEKAISQRAEFIFYVSQSLADRAKLEYPQIKHKIFVSMNATEPAFLVDETEKTIFPPEPYSRLKRPILGVIGTINDSLDFDLLLRCANLPETGTLLFVGPGCEQEGLTQLKASPKVVFTGKRPHAELPQWMQSVDLALIPYRDTLFNHSRSPMRLFDHIASGKPVIATSACDQVLGFKEYVYIAQDQDEYLALVKMHLACAENEAKRRTRIEFARNQTWECRMAVFYELLYNIGSEHR